MSVTEEAPTQTDKDVREDAELVVDVCMSVEGDDVVTIITDDENAHHASVVADVCVDRGAWPVVMNNETQVRRGLADTPVPDGAAAQPAPGDGELGRDHHHHQPRMGQPVRPRLRGQGVVRRTTPRSRRSSPEWARGG